MNIRILALSMSAILTSHCATPRAGSDYSGVVPRFEAAVREEMAQWGMSGVAAAWVDAQRTVYEKGFGEARADGVFRCGSVSKLFNAVAIMQLAEAGKLSLDAPAAQFAGEHVPASDFAGSPEVTLRHLLCHRSGMQRESSVGGYFDASEPGMQRTVASLRGTKLVTAPNARTRYSNIAPTLAGFCLEKAAAMPFADYQRRHILQPLEMSRSAWRREELPAGAACMPSHMRVADGSGGFFRRKAPVFDLGTIPAGNLFTTVGDLAKFLHMLAADGEAPGGRILPPGCLAKMYTPQSSDAGSFGLGFQPGVCHGRAAVGHTGAVYGFSTALLFLPREKLGVVVMANEDLAGSRISRLAALALGLMLEARDGAAAPKAVESARHSAEELEAFAGDYESQSFWAHLAVDAPNGRLQGTFSSQPCWMIPAEGGGSQFLLRSRLHDDFPVRFREDSSGAVHGFQVGAQEFVRVAADAAPAAALSVDWRRYCGSYGPEFIPLVVFGKFGHLYATTENMVDYRLTEVSPCVFAMPPGMYADENLTFHRDATGRIVSAELSGMVLPRRGN